MTDDPFGRISSAGSEDAGQPTAQADKGQIVSPAPANAPPLPATWRRTGSPSAIWTYRDARGRVLRHTLRFELADGGKDIRPVTLWRGPDDRLRWRFSAGGGDRPLYGLDRLAARPEASVLMVEGEKAADAAAERFPNYVAMTWPGGSQALGKADLTPLAGRTVIVWPDADAPGLKAGEALKRLASTQGVAAIGLVRLPDDLPKGWDLADAWPEGFGPLEAQAAIDRALNASRSETVSPWGYRLDSSGWFWAPAGDSKGGEAPAPVWLCSPFNLAAEARDEDGLDWSLVIDFRDRDGRAKREIIGRSELAGDAVDVRRRLMGAGLQIATSRHARERLQALLGTMVSTERSRLVNSAGWKGSIYVMPHRSIGAAAGESVIFRGRAGGTYHADAGTYEGWRDGVAAPMSGNAVGLFALSTAFAGPLLRDLTGEGGGFHLRGGSSTGKTTVSRAAGSVCGGGGPIGFSQTWRNTDNALEAVALAHNDGLLVLDEIKALSPEAAGGAAYALATGATKGRLKADAELRSRPSWRVIILSTGELSLSDLIRLTRGKDKSYAGQELRLIDIAVDMEAVGPGGQTMGVWQDIHGEANPADFSAAVQAASERHYGHALPLFVTRYLARLPDMRVAALEIQAEFLASVLTETDHGQARRGAARFALVAAAGELAAVLDVVPWKAGEATAAAALLFKRWADSFGRETIREDREAVRLVRMFIERFEGSRFRPLKEIADEDVFYDEAVGRDRSSERPREAEARSLDVAGWTGVHGDHGKVFHFHTEFMRTEIFAGMDAHAALRAIKAAGFLISNGEAGRLTNKVSVPGAGKRSFYSISAAILEADLHGDH